MPKLEILKCNPTPLELVREYLKERRVAVSRISLRIGPAYTKHERFYVTSHRYPNCRILVSCNQLIISIEWLVGGMRKPLPFAPDPEADMDVKVCDEAKEEFSLYDPESLQKIYEAVTDDRIRVRNVSKPS
jgi:hypothetical protein